MIDAVANIQTVLGGFSRLKKTDGRRVFRDARKPLRADLRDHASKQSDAGGRWPGRAASTIERRSRGKRKRGRLLGRLPLAMTMTVGVDFIRARSKVRRWSNVHNDGGRNGKGGTIPRRRYAWLSSEIRRKVRDLWVAALKRSWAGR